MNIQPITPQTPVCFGIACSQHGKCRRYVAVDGSVPGQAIATCEVRPGEFPLFVKEVLRGKNG